VGARFSTPVQTGPGTHPVSCTMGTGCFLGEKSGQDVTLTPHPLLVPWLWKGRAIPLLPLWAIWPVQSLIACTRVPFTFTLPYWYLASKYLFFFLLFVLCVFFSFFLSFLPLLVWVEMSLLDLSIFQLWQMGYHVVDFWEGHVIAV